jgi:hypothetical protein
MSTFVVHTPLATMRPIGADGERSRERMSALIARHLSSEHAAILADPVPLRDGSGIDWYVDTEGEVLDLASLSESERGAVSVRLAAILADIRAAADRIGGEGRQGGTSAALRNAAVFPGTSCIFAVREEGVLRPLLVGWGYESHEPALAQAFNVSVFATSPSRARSAGAVRRDVPTSPAALAGSDGAEAAGGRFAALSGRARANAGARGWLAAIALSLLAIVLFMTVASYLLPACGLRTPFGTVYFGLPAEELCRPAEQARSAAGARDLTRELAVLQEEYRRRRIGCLLEDIAAREVTAIPAAPEEVEAYERVDQRGDVQVTLTWNTADDLDLIVACPGGGHITYRSKVGCGGELDIDQNAREVSPAPVENITFAQGLQQDGEYQVLVNLYATRGGRPPVPFRVTIRDQNGIREVDGTATQPGQVVPVAPLARNGAGQTPARR